MRHDIKRILISRQEIAERTRELGEAITKDLHEKGTNGEIVLVAVMTGSIIFVADLMRHLPMKIRISLITASSYVGASTTSSGDPILGAVPSDIAGKHVLLVDDILDSGRTLTKIRSELDHLGPQSIRTCVLLRKKLDSAMAVPCEHVGFDIDDEFVVGCGLDYDGYYRNLPYLGVIAPE